MAGIPYLSTLNSPSPCYSAHSLPQTSCGQDVPHPLPQPPPQPAHDHVPVRDDASDGPGNIQHVQVLGYQFKKISYALFSGSSLIRGSFGCDSRPFIVFLPDQALLSQVMSCRQWLEEHLLYLLDESQVEMDDVRNKKRLGEVRAIVHCILSKPM